MTPEEHAAVAVAAERLIDVAGCLGAAAREGDERAMEAWVTAVRIRAAAVNASWWGPVYKTQRREVTP